MSFRVLVFAFILFFIGDRFVLSAKNDLAEAMDRNKDGFVTWEEFKNNEFPDIYEIDEAYSMEDSIGEFLVIVIIMF